MVFCFVSLLFLNSVDSLVLANALMHGRDGTSGVDWTQAAKVGYSLLLSPLFGSANIDLGEALKLAKARRGKVAEFM